MTASGPAPAPPLDLAVARSRHLLATGVGVIPEDIEALAISRCDTAAWVGPGTLRLLPGVHLSGPFEVDEQARTEFDLPREAGSAYVLDCPQRRGHPLPAELTGFDPILDAFASGVLTGVEQEAVDHLRAMARRLGGALRLAGSGAVVEPDPDSATDLTVHSPIWLEPAACLAAIREVAPAARDLMADVPAEAVSAEAMEIYGIGVPCGPDLIEITVAGSDAPPLVLRGADWALRGVISYSIRWRPADPAAMASRVPRNLRRPRAQAIALIEQLASVVYEAAGGAVCDDDGFLVDLADLH